MPVSDSELLILMEYRGPSINYVVSVGGKGSSPKDDLLHRPYLIKKDEGGGGAKIADFKKA